MCMCYDQADQSSLEISDFEPINPTIEGRMVVIKGKSNAGYFSRSSTMADDEEVVETTINWEDSLATNVSAIGEENFLEDDDCAREGSLEEEKPAAQETTTSTKFRKIF